jgi:hypothetical protein
MRLRGPLVVTGALGLAVLAVGVVAVWTSIGHAQAIRAMAVTTTITIDPASHETFAPPPSDATPAMTPLQAYAQAAQESGGGTVRAIPADVTVRLGLLTFPVGPYCGAECDGYKVQNGIAYHALNELAYGYSYSVCKPGSALPARRCIRWTFLDASTGQVIDMVLNLAGRRPGLTGRIRAAAIPTLRAAAIKAARHNGEPAPRSIKAVATTHARALLAATPGDRITQGRYQQVYLVIMRGIFRYEGPAPPGARPVRGTYLAVVFNVRTLAVEDVGLSKRKPPLALSTYGPVVTLR